MSRYLSARILESIARMMRGSCAGDERADDAMAESASSGEPEGMHPSPSSSHIRAAKPASTADG